MMANPSPEIRAKIPIGRLGKPDEIANIVLMLVQNGYMTNKVCCYVLYTQQFDTYTSTGYLRRRRLDWRRSVIQRDECIATTWYLCLVYLDSKQQNRT